MESQQYPYPTQTRQTIWLAVETETRCAAIRAGARCALIDDHPTDVEHLTEGGASW